MVNSSKKNQKQNLKKQESDDNNDDSSYNEEETNEEVNEETEQTDNDNITDADDKKTAEAETETDVDKKLKPGKEATEASEKVIDNPKEEADSDEEAAEESIAKEDIEQEKDTTPKLDEEKTAPQESSDNNDDHSDINLILYKAETEAAEDYIFATGEFLSLIQDFCSFALEDEESEHDQQNLKDLLDHINNLLSHLPPRTYEADFSLIETVKMQEFFDKYSELIKDYLALQSKVLQANLIDKKTELIQQASVLAYTISTKLPERDEMTENLRLAAAKLSYYCARYVITTSIKSFVQKLDYVPAVVKLAKDFIRDTIQLIKDPSTMTQKLLSNYFKNLDSNISNLKNILGLQKKDLAVPKNNLIFVKKKGGGISSISTIAEKTLFCSEVMRSLLSKKINYSIESKNRTNHKNHREKILQSRAEKQKNPQVKARGG